MGKLKHYCVKIIVFIVKIQFFGETEDCDFLGEHVGFFSFVRNNNKKKDFRHKQDPKHLKIKEGKIVLIRVKKVKTQL